MRRNRSPPSDDEDDRRARGRERFNREREVEEYDSRRSRDYRESDYGRTRDSREYHDSEYYRDRTQRDRRSDNWERNSDRGGHRRDERSSRDTWERDRAPPSRDDFGRDSRGRDDLDRKRDQSPPRKLRWDTPAANPSTEHPQQPHQPILGFSFRHTFPPVHPGQSSQDVLRYKPSPVTGTFPNAVWVADPNAEYLLTMKQYMATIQDPYISDEDAMKRFENYKNDHTAKQLAKFFPAHKTEEWFIEKYHPNSVAKRDQEKCVSSAAACKQFKEDFNQGKFNNLNFDDSEVKSFSRDHRDASPLRDDDMLEEGETALAPGDKPTRVLFIKSVPPNIQRAQIIELCQKMPGFLRLELSEPNPAKKFHRVGWVTYDESTNINEAFQALNNVKIDTFEFHFGIFRTSGTKNLKIPPVSSTEDRAKKDLFLIKKLATLFDKEKGLESSLTHLRIPENPSGPTEVKKALDLMIVYLRQVHYFDYYSALEFETEDALARKCGGFPIRTRSNDPSPDDNWEKNLDSKIETRLKVTLDDDLCKKLGIKNVSGEVEKMIQANVIKVEEGKFKCDLCTKLFKGTDFVTKHIKTKHEEKILEVQNENTFWNNYIRDPNHLIPTPPPAPAAAPPSPFVSNNPNQFARSIPTFPNATLPLRPIRPPIPFQQVPLRPFPNFELNAAGGPFRPKLNVLPRPRPVVSRSVVAENDPRPLRNYADLDDIPESAAFFDYRNAE